LILTEAVLILTGGVLALAGSGKIPYAGDFVTSIFLPGSAFPPFSVIAKSVAMKQSGGAYFRIASLLRSPQ
jgi:hypothetical protein